MHLTKRRWPSSREICLQPSGNLSGKSSLLWCRGELKLVYGCWQRRCPAALFFFRCSSWCERMIQMRNKKPRLSVAESVPYQQWFYILPFFTHVKTCNLNHIFDQMWSDGLQTNVKDVNVACCSPLKRKPSLLLVWSLLVLFPAVQRPRSFSQNGVQTA